MSSGGQIALRITAEEAQALAALGRLVQAQDAAAASTKRYGEASRQAAAEARALERDAAKIKEAVATPLERYQQELGRLKEMLAGSKISQEQYNRAIEQANARYVQNVQAQAASTEAAKARAAAEAQASQQEADAARRASRVKEQVRTAEDRYQQEVAELAGHLDAGRISQDEYTRAVEQSRSRLDEATGATARLRAEQSAAAKVMEATTTAGDRYSKEMAELETLVRSGRITQDQYNRAVEQAEDRFNEATGATARLRQAEQEAARVREQVRTPTERYNATLQQLRHHLQAGRITQDEYTRAVARADGELRQASEAGNMAFGSNALGSLKSYVAGFASLTGAIGLANRALRDMEETRKEVAEKQKASRMGIGELAQLAETPEEFSKLVGTAEQVYRRGGATDMSEAARVVFAAKSAEVMGDIDLITDLKASGLISTPDTVIKAAATLFTSMGQEETGSIRDIINKAFGGAKESPGDVPQLLEAVAKSGATAKAIGISDEELIAATAIASKGAGGESEGGTQIYSLIRSLTQIRAERPEMQGQNLMQMVKSIEAMQLPEDELMDLMGRAEALNAYRVLLQNEQSVAGLIGESQRAMQQDVVGKKLGFHLADPSLRASRDVVEAQAQEELSAKTLGSVQNRYEAHTSREVARMRQRGDSEWGISLYNIQRAMGQFFNPPTEARATIEEWSEGRAPSRQAAPPPPPPPGMQMTDREAIGVLRDIRDESRKQNQKLDQMARPGRLGNPDIDR